MKGKNKKFLLVCCAMLALAATLALTGYFFATASTLPDPKSQSGAEQLHYLASKKFASLPVADKHRYLDAIDRRKLFKASRTLSPAERQKLFKNLRPLLRARFRKRMRERLKSYAALKTPAEKRAYLDKIIDRIVALRRKRREQRQAGANNNSQTERNKRRWRGPSLARIREHIETSDPAERARFMEFIVDLRQRMKERGVTSPFHHH